jgi:hypothetical protein
MGRRHGAANSQAQEFHPEVIGLIREIARGGMRAISEARPLSLNRFVVPNMILARQLGGQTEVREFDSKARA